MAPQMPNTKSRPQPIVPAFRFALLPANDIADWATVTAPSLGFEISHFYTSNSFYGYWILITEIVLCGVVPGVILVMKSTRENPNLRLVAIILAVIGVCLNRWVMVLQIMAVASN